MPNGSVGRRRGRFALAYPDLLVNDLEPAAHLPASRIGDALEELRRAGASVALLTGSGPTAFGIFPDLRGAEEAASGSAGQDSIVCEAGRAP